MTEIKQDSIQKADQQRVEYEQASEMARLHGGYRFQVLGFFATIMTALVGGTYLLLYKEEQLFLGFLIGSLGIIVSTAAIAIDRRTMQLYLTCEWHARRIEEYWRRASTAQQPDSELAFPENGVFTELNKIDGDGELRPSKRKFLRRHSSALRLLFRTAQVVFVVLILYALFLARYKLGWWF